MQPIRLLLLAASMRGGLPRFADSGAPATHLARHLRVAPAPNFEQKKRPKGKPGLVNEALLRSMEGDKRRGGVFWCLICPALGALVLCALIGCGSPVSLACCCSPGAPRPKGRQPTAFWTVCSAPRPRRRRPHAPPSPKAGPAALPTSARACSRP